MDAVRKHGEEQGGGNNVGIASTSLSWLWETVMQILSIPSIHKQLLLYFSLVDLTNHKLTSRWASWIRENGVGWENLGNTENMKNMENMDKMENIDQMA